MRTDYETHFHRITPIAPKKQHLNGLFDADVVVIGGGLAGLSSALSLAERRLNVCLVEAKTVGAGASGRNGGHVLPGFDLNLSTLVKKVGTNAAAELYNLSVEAVSLVKERASSISVADELSLSSGLQACSPYLDYDTASRRLDWFRDHFRGNREVWDAERTYDQWRSTLYRASVHDPDSFTLNPLAYARKLQSMLRGMGVQIFEDTPVSSITRVPGGLIVHCSSGNITCDQVVVCCSASPTAPIKPLSKVQFALYSYMLVSAPAGKSLEDAIRSTVGVMDLRHSFAYYRPLEDGRLIWGGRSGARWTPSKIAQRLGADIRLTYSQLADFHVESAWSGRMGCTLSGMPQIGKLSERIWFSQGHGGHGFASTALAGEIIASSILDKSDNWRRFEPFTSLPTVASYFQLPAIAFSGWRAARDRVALKGRQRKTHRVKIIY
ncbi:NAD(P)/FAD-dependent oxidoreductase [Agrobacterium sp. 22-226-1]